EIPSGQKFSDNQTTCSNDEHKDDVTSIKPNSSGHSGSGETNCYNPRNDDGDDNDEHLDAGIYECYEISGEVFLDENNDGCDEGSDFSGVKIEIELFPCNTGQQIASKEVSSSSSGGAQYTFGPDESGSSYACLVPDLDYEVKFSILNEGNNRDKYRFTTNSGSCSDGDKNDAIAGSEDPHSEYNGKSRIECIKPSQPGGTPPHHDGSIYECQSISGVVFEDANNNGCFDTSESPRDGISVTLFECDGGELKSINTNGDGEYKFGPLESGEGKICLDPAKTYKVQITAPTNYSFSSNEAPGGCSVDKKDDVGVLSSNNNPLNGNKEIAESVCYHPLDTGQDGDEDEHIDAGIYKCQAMTGSIYLDLNNDGCNTSENPVGIDIDVKLIECDNNGPTGTTTSYTASGGTYTFGPEQSGGAQICIDPAKTYSVEFSLPENYSFGDLNCDDDVTSVSETYENGEIGTSECNPPSNPPSTNIFECQSIEGEIFVDTNGDGCQNNGESRISGVSVKVYLHECGNSTAIEEFTTSNGSYQFGPGVASENGVDYCLDPAKKYEVHFELPQYYRFVDLSQSSISACAADSEYKHDVNRNSYKDDGIDHQHTGSTGCFNPRNDLPT
ncbi:MAG: SdrD B-like domain-containing protein, partial [Bacteroidota bacterium]